MKQIFLALLVTLSLLSCTRRIPEKMIEVRTDTIIVVDTAFQNALLKEVGFWKDSVIKLTTTISYENYSNARKIEKIKYYITITEKKPENKKFFYGWIRRTMSEE